MSELDISKLDHLSDKDCLRLLEEGSYVGRVGFLNEGNVTIFPVNYIVDQKYIVFRTARDGLLAKVVGQTVAFEVDNIRAIARNGWSVLVLGVASRMTDENEIDRLRRGPLNSWAWKTADQFIRISIDKVSGRSVADL